MPTAISDASPRVVAAGAVICAGALAMSAALGPVAVGIVLLAVQLLLALAWLAVADTPGAVESFTIVAISAVTANALAARNDGYGVGDVVGIVALAFLAALLVQLRRTPPRTRVVESIGVTISAVVVVVLAAHLVAVTASREGSGIAAVAVLALGTGQVVGRLLDVLVPRPAVVPGSSTGIVGALMGVCAAVAVGAALGNSVQPLSVRSGALLAGAVALAAVAVDAFVDLVHHDIGNERQRAALRPLSALLPFSAAAPVAYAVTRLLIA